MFYVVMLAINPIKFNFNSNYQNTRQNRTAQIHLPPVSFSGSVKTLEHYTGGISRKVAADIHAEAKPIYKTFIENLFNLFGDAIANEKFPKRPIFEITHRLKEPESIAAKAISNDFSSKAQVKEKCGDIIGARIVLNDTRKTQVDKILERLTNAIRLKVLDCTEIESFRSIPEHAYVTDDRMRIIERVSARPGKTFSSTNTPYKSGYTAFHMNLNLPKGYVGEIQVMGKHMNEFKEVEDLLYKIKHNKNLDHKYKYIQDKLQPIMKKLTPKQKNALEHYTTDQYMAVREAEIANKPFEYLPVPKNLPPELDFKTLHEMQQTCDAKAV